jgi:hypothetical protein
MAAAKITQIWTVFITALVKCLVAMRFRTAPGAAAPAEGPAEGPAAVVPVACFRPLTAAMPGQRSGDRSVPPTMKQRIRAEAHGASPASRGPSVRDHDAVPEVPMPAGPLPAHLCTA